MKLQKNRNYGKPISIGYNGILAEAIAELEPYVSTDETRYFVNGIYFEPIEGDSMVRAVATDGRRLAIKTIHTSVFGDFIPSGIYVVTVSTGAITFYSIEGQYPNYEKVIPDSSMMDKYEMTIYQAKKKDFFCDNSVSIFRFFEWSKNPFNIDYFADIPYGNYICYGPKDRETFPSAFIWENSRIKVVIMPMMKD